MTGGDAPRRIGIMGGTFDPIHNGHLVCAEEARIQFSLDEVVFVPSGNPWQKRGVSAAEDRYLMTVLATSSNDSFSVSRIEIDLGGPTYTIDTLRAFREFYGEKVELFFITGTDAVAEILSWKDPEAVLEEAHFIAANRPGYSLGSPAGELFSNRVSVMEIPALAISSTDIRRRVTEGRPIRYLLPREVREFIDERKLYRTTG
ncbi:MAG TPA: nicotinate-nucleotide adenylyltransferase [Actinomycetota bacterium]|nr:nicotinate-nucleotide adenylyltransferase [Actinomycetota bacterium]